MRESAIPKRNLLWLVGMAYARRKNIVKVLIATTKFWRLNEIDFIKHYPKRVSSGNTARGTPRRPRFDMRRCASKHFCLLIMKMVTQVLAHTQ